MMTIDEFKEKTQINPEGKVIQFTCLKCKSNDIKIETAFDYSMGSEYTGIYDESVSIVFKCMNCGAAWSYTDR